MYISGNDIVLLNSSYPERYLMDEHVAEDNVSVTADACTQPHAPHDIVGETDQSPFYLKPHPAVPYIAC